MGFDDSEAGPIPRSPAGRKVRLLMGHCRNLDPAVQAATVAVFAEIALAGDEGIRIGAIEVKLGLSRSGTSRHVTQLTERTWRDGVGADVITLLADPADSRAKLARLNAKGRRVWAGMLAG